MLGLRRRRIRHSCKLLLLVIAVGFMTINLTLMMSLSVMVTNPELDTGGSLHAEKPWVCPVERWLELTKLDHWQQLSGQNPKIYVYSAYFDITEPEMPLIRIVGAMDMSVKPSESVKICGGNQPKYDIDLYCKLWFSDGTHHVVKLYKAWCHPETWPVHRVAMFYFLCPWNTSQTPCSVSLLRKKEETANNVMRLHNNIKDYTSNMKSPQPLYQGDFAVCVKPIYANYNYKDYLQFIEFIEFNRLLGVEHFTFYLDAADTVMEQVFNYYLKRKIIDVLPYKLGVEPKKEIHRVTVALSDCLLRYRYRYKYVLMIDLDEIIMPHQHDNLHDMMAEIHQDPQDVAFQFQNGFFPVSDTKMPLSNINYLATVNTTFRIRQLTKFGPGGRSKFIVQPEKVTIVGNHFTQLRVGNYTEKEVNAAIAYLHHYRHTKGTVDTQSMVTDTRAHHFADEMISRVRQVLNATKQVDNSAMSIIKVRKHKPL